MTPITRLLLAWSLVLLAVLGCKSSSATPCRVSGKITYKGQPVTGGTIAFHRTQEELSGSYAFSINPDGTYEGGSMPAEEYVITVETESINPNRPIPTYRPMGPMADSNTKMGPDDYRKKMQEMGKMPGITEAQGTYVKIPAKYADKKTSPLKKKLENGKNVLDFDLTD